MEDVDSQTQDPGGKIIIIITSTDSWAHPLDTYGFTYETGEFQGVYPNVILIIIFTDNFVLWNFLSPVKLKWCKLLP